jgi:hypothetical protein
LGAPPDRDEIRRDLFEGSEEESGIPLERGTIASEEQSYIDESFRNGEARNGSLKETI